MTRSVTRLGNGEPPDMYNDPAYASALELWTAKKAAEMDIKSGALPPDTNIDALPRVREIADQLATLAILEANEQGKSTK